MSTGPLAAAAAAGDLDALEDAWLERLSAAPTEVEPFAEAALALVAREETDQALFLLDLLEEQLVKQGAHEARLELLQRTGHVRHPETADLHAAIVAALRERYADSGSFEGLAEKLGLFRAIDDIPKIWDKVERIAELMDYDEGTVVWLEGQGAGRVIDVNLALGSLRVDLVVGSTVSVGFAAARKMLRRLPEGHLLWRKVEEPEALEKLAGDSPEELVRLTLASHDEPLLATEIRQALAGVVADDDWSSFWARARKSSNLVALPGKRQKYTWADSAGDAVAALGDRFATADLAQRLELLRSHGDRDPELKATMVASLRKTTEGLAAASPGEAFAIAIALERAGAEPPPEADPDTLLREVADPRGLVASLGDRSLREEAYRRLPHVRAGWEEIFEALLFREDEARALDRLADALEQRAPERLERAVGDLLAQPRRNPAAFVWLAERAAGDDKLQTRNPLRLFQQVLAATGDEAFSALRRRLQALADSGSTLPRLLPHLDVDQARRAEEALVKAAGLEGYQKEMLRNGLHLKFPALRKQEVPLYASPEAIAAKREELRLLLEEEIPANRKAIEEARELGDLRENFEYKSARQRHEYLAARSAGLARDLERARPIDAGSVETTSVRLGTRVTLRGSSGERSYTILGPWDSDPEQGVLSNESDLAQSLLGLEVGAGVEVLGEPMEVAAIDRWR